MPWRELKKLPTSPTTPVSARMLARAKAWVNYGAVPESLLFCGFLALAGALMVAIWRMGSP